MKYKQLEHTTDLKLRIFGVDLDELFTNAGLSIFDVIDLRKRKPRKNLGPSRLIKITSLDQESLLVDWLSELLYLHDTHNENYFDINITKLTETELEAEVKGIASKNDKFDVKGVTYHELEIGKTAKGYEAVVLFDI
jgi:SHS2 domain-containing protein